MSWLICFLFGHTGGDHMDPLPEWRLIDRETGLYQWRCLRCREWIEDMT